MVVAVCSSSYGHFEGYPHDVETIDLGRAEETTHTIRFPLPVRTVRVTKTVPVPVPYPIRQDVPVPVPYPKPVPVPVSYPVPVQFQQHAAPVGLVLYNPGRSLGTYDGYPGATGSTGATIGHHEGSIGVVVGASYGVSGPVGATGKFPGTVVSESVGASNYANAGGPGEVQGQRAYGYQNSGSDRSSGTGGSADSYTIPSGQGAYRFQNSGSDVRSGTGRSADSYSITKSVEPTYDESASDGGANSIQGYGEDAKGI